MDYIEDDFTDALIDAVCGKLPSTWYTLIGENFDPDEETIVKEADNKKDIEDAFNESKDDFDSLYVVLNDESYVDQFMNRLKRRVDSGRWEEPSEKNWFNSYIEVASLKRQGVLHFPYLKPGSE